MLPFCSVLPDGGQELHPSVRAIDPPDGYTFVGRDTAVNVDVNLPNVGAGVKDTTLNPGTVRLLRTSDGMQVDATVNTSGGNDAIVLQPKGVLDPQTDYTFLITSGVTDQSGASFVPFQSHFSTGDFTNLKIDPRYRYAIQQPALFNGPPVSSLLIGPDGKLYATALDGIIRRWTLAPDGTLTDLETFSALIGRTVLGIAFQPDDPMVFWVTTDAPVSVQPAPDWSGTITRITLQRRRRGFVARAEDMVTGLPRSPKDHMTNSLAFGPDGALYVAQGSMTGSGAPDPTWYNAHEHLLSAAVLRLDLKLLSTPIDVRTEPLAPPPATDGGLGGGGDLLADAGTLYDPTAPGAPLTLYGMGLRNAYDLVWHSNGHLYCPTNGTAAGAYTPATPPGVTPVVPALTSIPTQDDFLFDVVAGGYYGHPDPARGQYVLNGGNPTPAEDPDEVAASSDGGVGYPVGILPDTNWKGSIYNFSRNRSPDGALEVKGPAFGGALKGHLLVVEYSAGDDLLALPIPAGGGPIDRNQVLQVASGLSDPVDVTEDVATGNLYVAQLVQGGLDGGAIVLLRPDGGSP